MVKADKFWGKAGSFYKKSADFEGKRADRRNNSIILLKMNKEEFFVKNPPDDGWVYQTAFDGDTEEESFDNLRKFLQENGFGDIPMPQNARRLWFDYLRPDDNGNFVRFIWHPIIISQSEYHKNGLVLSIYNEQIEDHLKLWEEVVKR